MKKFISIAFVGSFTLLLVGCQFGESKNSSSALEFNDAIVDLQMQIVTPVMEVLQFEGDNMTAGLNGAIAITENCIDTLKNMEVFPGGEEMQAKALDLFGFYLKTMKGPWMEACTLFDEKGKDMTSEDLLHFRELLSAPAEEEVQYDEAFANAQKEFVKANRLVLEKNSAVQDKIDGVE